MINLSSAHTFRSPRRKVGKDSIGVFDCGIYPHRPTGTPPIFLREHPIRLRDTAGGEAQQCSSNIRCYPTLVFYYICRISEAVRHSQAKNVIFACLCAHLSLYLWNVRVEWHSWKYDLLLSLHSTFRIFVH